MAQAARKYDTHNERRRPALRLVKTPTRRGTKASSRAAAASAARHAFMTFAVVVSIVALLGMGRVWLSVQAAEASIEASELRRDIRLERYEGDMLEIKQSALGSPSRIRAIACAAMDMAPAEKVTYLDVPQPTKNVAENPEATTGSTLKRAVASILDVTAGEAQVLLVGDVGLASSR